MATCAPNAWSRRDLRSDIISHECLPLPSQGKRFVFFEFTIGCKWEGELVGSAGSIVGRGDGNVTIPDVDQDSAKDSDYAIEVSVDDDADADDKRIMVSDF